MLSRGRSITTHLDFGLTTLQRAEVLVQIRVVVVTHLLLWECSTNPEHIVVIHDVGFLPLGGKERYDVAGSFWEFSIFLWSAFRFLLHVLRNIRYGTPLLLHLLIDIGIVRSVVVLGLLGVDLLCDGASFLSSLLK